MTSIENFIEKNETNEFFTGSYGIVIQPDQYTATEAIKQAQLLIPNASYVVKVPHITLYHAKFTDLPISDVLKILAEIKKLENQTLILKDLQVYGGKFLFWNIVKTPTIQQAHEQTLSLSLHLDKESQARAIEEGLSLTPQEKESLKKFGHPLMKELYIPHITLAYDNDGIKLPEENMSIEYKMTINHINFAQIGQYGTIKNIINIE